MIIDITNQLKTDASFPLYPASVFTGSALPVEVIGVPLIRGGAYVTGVKIALVNADGVTIEIPLVKYSNGVWRGIFAASNFVNYGRVLNGLTVKLVLSTDPDAASHIETVGRGIFEVLSGSASAQPGDPTTHYQVRGDAEYLKSNVVDGVQHFKKVEIAYDSEMGDWGFSLTGDYILSADGEFVPANS